MNEQRTNKHRGFSLFELMAVVTIVGIIAALAVPNIRPIVQSMRIRSESSALSAALARARSESSRVQKATVLCVRKSGLDQCDSGANWANGWLLFVDNNGDGAYAASDGDQLLTSHAAVASQLTLTNTFTSAGYVSFTASGNLSTVGSTVSGQEPEFRVCDDRTGGHGRRLSVATIGRVRVETLSCPAT